MSTCSEQAKIYSELYYAKAKVDQWGDTCSKNQAEQCRTARPISKTKLIDKYSIICEKSDDWYSMFNRTAEELKKLIKKVERSIGCTVKESEEHLCMIKTLSDLQITLAKLAQISTVTSYEEDEKILEEKIKKEEDEKAERERKRNKKSMKRSVKKGIKKGMELIENKILRKGKTKY